MKKVNKILLFGNNEGLPISASIIPQPYICGIVAAENRAWQHSELALLAQKTKVPFLIQPLRKSQNYSKFLQSIQNLKPNIILVNCYSQMLYPELLSLPSYAAINIHMALLPKYRGANPIQWALLNNDAHMGATMHFMDANFDTGDIIAQKSFPVSFAETWVDIHQKNLSAIAELLQEQLPNLLAGNLQRYPQDPKLASSYPRRRPEDGEINWQWPIIQIYNLIRALVSPHPGAYFFDGHEKHVIQSHLNIAEVILLKQRFFPSVFNMGDATLYLQVERSSNTSLSFDYTDVDKTATIFRLTDINFYTGDAKLEIENGVTNTIHSDQRTQAFRQWIAKELNISTVI